MATLKATVHVTDESGSAHVFGPADEVPEWAQSLITNPKAWAEAPTSASRLADPAPKAPANRATSRRKAGGGGTSQ
ncbi:hypothetical protein [Streptomyces sp. NPDC088554]|uniref:hypothetical protein n=1 Tax=Streptomyces sp. NPDC088554 TaxID=3365865 RepID=UPI003823D565